MKFRVTGLMGDVVYALPTIKWFTEHRDERAEIRIDAQPKWREGISFDYFKPLVPLLEAQEYVSSVQPYDPKERDVIDLTKWTEHTKEGASIPLLIARYCGVGGACINEPWLEVEPADYGPRIAVSRVPRYTGVSFPWNLLMREYQFGAQFLGTARECDMFSCVFHPIPHYETPDLLEAARIIAGARCFIGNASCLFAIAEGLKQNAVLEVWTVKPNHILDRENLLLGWDCDFDVTQVEQFLKE